MICRHNGALPQNVTSLENRFNHLPIFSPKADMSKKFPKLRDHSRGSDGQRIAVIVSDQEGIHDEITRVGAELVVHSNTNEVH